MKTKSIIVLFLVCWVSLHAQSSNEGVLRYVVIDKSGIQRSTIDGGKTWTERAQNREMVFTHEELLRYKYIPSGGVLRSTTDGGRTWTEGVNTTTKTVVVVKSEGRQSIVLSVLSLSSWLSLNRKDSGLRIYSVAAGSLVYEGEGTASESMGLLAAGVYLLESEHEGQRSFVLLCLTE